MKKMLVLLAAFALTAGAASAQTTTESGTMGQGQYGRGQGRGQMMNMTPEQRADMQAQRLTKQLGLSAEQTEKVKQMELARVQEMQAMRGQASAGGDRETMRQNMQAMRTKYDTQLKGILTADQYTQYSQLQQDRMNGRMGGGQMNGQMNDQKVKTKKDKTKAKS